MRIPLAPQRSPEVTAGDPSAMPAPPSASAGQTTLPLFVFMIPLMLAFMALGVDAAQYFLERRNAQGAADLAALSSARHLHAGVTALERQAARDAAYDVAEANGYPRAQVNVTTPYGGSDQKVEVTIDSDIDTFFKPILVFVDGGDHSSMEVDARAVAYGGEGTASGSGYALFAIEGCPSNEKTIDVSGSTNDFVGRVHSNSDLYISGSNNDFVGPSTHSCPTRSFHAGGGGNRFDPAPAKGPLAPAPEPDPIGLRIGDFTCDFPVSPTVNAWSGQPNTASSSLTIGSSHFDSSGKLRSGTYCSAGSINISRSNVTSAEGGVTLVARNQVEISGSGFDLAPAEHGMLLVSFGNSDVAVKISGSTGRWGGTVYAPFGTAEQSGSGNLTITGGIVARRIKLNGSDLVIEGDAGAGGETTKVITLLE